MRVKSITKFATRVLLTLCMIVAVARAAAEPNAGAPHSVLQPLDPSVLFALQESVISASDQAFAQAVKTQLAKIRPDVSAIIDDLTGRVQRGGAQDELERLQLEAQVPPQFRTLIPGFLLKVSDVRLMLTPDEAALMIVPHNQTTSVVVITTNDSGLIEAKFTAKEIDHLVRRLRWDAGATVDGSAEELNQLSALSVKRRASFDRLTAYKLYQALVEPVMPLLSDKRRVAVVATGALAALPFHVLVTQPPVGEDDDPASLRATHWFGDQLALVHLPSIQLFTALRNGRPSSGDKFLGIGDPALDGRVAAEGRGSARKTRAAMDLANQRTGLSTSGHADVAAIRRMPELPGTATELRVVGEMLGGGEPLVLARAAATESALRATDLSRAQVILFSTHGLTAAESRIIGLHEAGLILTPPPVAKNSEDDGYLSASEVLELRLDADWAILSACNTATGERAEGGGLGLLSRAFLFAGSRALLASHWPVSDEAAPTLIGRTVALSRSGLSRAEALQAAMREVRLNATKDTDTETWAHPFYWAPFVLVGDGH